MTTEQAIEMLRAGGVDLASELSNVEAAYLDMSDDAERNGEELEFSLEEFEAALRAAA